jgi:hypothetical protein
VDATGRCQRRRSIDPNGWRSRQPIERTPVWATSVIRLQDCGSRLRDGASLGRPSQTVAEGSDHRAPGSRARRRGSALHQRWRCEGRGALRRLTPTRDIPRMGRDSVRQGTACCKSGGSVVPTPLIFLRRLIPLTFLLRRIVVIGESRGFAFAEGIARAPDSGSANRRFESSLPSRYWCFSFDVTRDGS